MDVLMRSQQAQLLVKHVNQPRMMLALSVWSQKQEMKPETHQGEVAEHVISSDVQLMLQTQREEEDRVRVLTSVSPRRSKRGVSAWSQNKRPLWDSDWAPQQH